MSFCDWRLISYLATGNPRQQALYRMLNEEQLLSRVSPLDSACVSSICLGLDTETSDVDIICQEIPAVRFAPLARDQFGSYEGFSLSEWNSKESEITVVRFSLHGFFVEFFVCSKPIEEQNAWKHLTAFARLLEFGGEQLRGRVVERKKAGMKTEPAFADVLQISGDPYEELFRLADATDDELRVLVEDAACSGFERC